MKRLLAVFVVIFAMSQGQAEAADRIIVTTSDFSSGSLASVHPVTHEASINILNIHSDAEARTYLGKIYVVNRQGQDNILVLDGEDLGTPVLQFSVGNGTNPQDIAFVSLTKAYVSRRATQELLIVNPTTGDSLGGIDLSFVADADGVPEMTLMTIYNNRLYVTCQRLDRDAFSAPTDRSEVVVVDLLSDTVLDIDSEQDGLQGIILQAKNPFGGQVRIGNRLYISCVGDFGNFTDGGIEVLNLSTNTTEGIALSEGELGGNAGAIAMVSQGVGFVVVGDASFNNTVKAFNLATDGLPVLLEGPSGGYVASMATAAGRLYISDQGSFPDQSSGLRVFDSSSYALVAGPISTGLPPSYITILIEARQSDFNGDRTVDLADFILFANAYNNSTGGFDPGFDLNGDGLLAFSDFVQFVKFYGHQE